jgi:hypothetical protein
VNGAVNEAVNRAFTIHCPICPAIHCPVPLHLCPAFTALLDSIHSSLYAGTEEQRRNRGGTEEEQRRNRGGTEEEQRRNRGGTEEEQRRNREGTEEEQRRNM